MNLFRSFFSRRSGEPEGAGRNDPDRQLVQAKERMLREHLQARGIHDPRVLEAMREVPREHFMGGGAARQVAYDDAAHGIDCGQTISQPYIVALMTQALDLRGGERVLEVGTGSGYQTAILAWLGAEIVTIERHAELAQQARERLQQLGLDRQIDFRVADGSEGCPERAPYQRILVAAASRSIPEPLWDQLAQWGVLVGPFGSEHHQTLSAFRKLGERRVEEVLCPCRFVPLVSNSGESTG